MSIASTTRRIVNWFIHPEMSVGAGCADAVEKATDRLEEQTKQLKRAVKSNGKHRRDMLGLAIDDLRGRPTKTSKPKPVPTMIPPPPLYTPAVATTRKTKPRS